MDPRISLIRPTKMIDLNQQSHPGSISYPVAHYRSQSAFEPPQLSSSGIDPSLSSRSSQSTIVVMLTAKHVVKRSGGSVGHFCHCGVPK